MAEMTKSQKVENYLLEHGSITSWEAIQKFKATRLSDIIFKMRKRGYIIDSIREEYTNSDGETSRFVRYRLYKT